MWFAWNLLIAQRLFIFKLFEILQPFFPKDILLIADSFGENSDLINSSPLVEYCIKNKIKCKFVYNYNNKSFYPISDVTINFNKKNEDFMPCLFWTLLRTHTLVRSVTFLSYFDEYFAKNKYINYVFSQHGPSLLKDIGLMGHKKDIYNYVVTSSKIENQIFLDKNFDKSQLIPTGLIRYDKLNKKEHNTKNIFVMFTWRKYLDNQNYYGSVYHEKVCSFLKNKYFLNYLKENNIQLTVALHPCIDRIKNLLENLQTLFKSENINFIYTREISKYIGKSDLLITDYSSVFFDFAYLDIPIIFYRFDFDTFKKSDLIFEGITDIQQKDKHIYNVCYEENEVIEKIKYYTKNNFVLEEKNREKNKKLLDYVERGKCCENFIKFLEKIRSQNE